MMPRTKQTEIYDMMSRDPNKRHKKAGAGGYGQKYQGFQARGRQGDYLGAESPNWRDSPPDQPQHQNITPPLQDPYAEFLQNGWYEYEAEKQNTAGSDVHVLKEEQKPLDQPPVDSDKWVKLISAHLNGNN